MANDIPNPRPVERILAYMVVSAVGLSVLSFLALIIATAVGTTGEQFSAFPWPLIIVLPLVGLPIGLAFMIALLVVTAVRRGREAKDASK